MMLRKFESQMLKAATFIVVAGISTGASADDGYSIQCIKSTFSPTEFVYDFLDGSGNVLATHIETSWYIQGNSNPAQDNPNTTVDDNTVGRGLSADQVKAWCLNKFTAHADDYIQAQFAANTTYRSATWSLDGRAEYRYCSRTGTSGPFICSLSDPKSKTVDPVVKEAASSNPLPCSTGCDPTPGPITKEK